MATNTDYKKLFKKMREENIRIHNRTEVLFRGISPLFAFIKKELPKTKYQEALKIMGVEEREIDVKKS